MAISVTSIVTFATQINKLNIPGIQDEVRDRLEWTWGLRHGQLDEYLQTFVDPEGVLADDSVFVFPPSKLILDVWLRHERKKFGVRKPHIDKLYKGRTSFEYVVVPVDPASPVATRILVAQVPPHLVLTTTTGKIMKTWGFLPPKESDALSVALLSRANATTISAGWPPLRTSDLNTMYNLHSAWSWADYVPPSFLSETSDQTLVEEDEEEIDYSRPIMIGSGKRISRSEAGSSASCREPKRRLLPSELQQAFASADDDDDAVSSDSHISGVEDPEESARALGDEELEDGAWVQEMENWAAGTAGADEEALLNDAQITDDPRETPRVATSLDLERPDYLSKHKIRTVA
ncbi:hypothetical protein C8F04DRAFT_1109561 [Mycena alexandri]|uniref:Uncharacterized protein n=1 Tax=Mycena alexandri TaxID=1745969 RepID=A0AAD6SSJ8_9AGAR|nr:hypothetical protein C8F04DRAFT_1109561 [Mycena alexandri]